VDTTERVAQSRRALTGAVIDLMRTSPARRITITEVCRRANVTRPTFYQHYASLDDLVGRAVAERLREHQQAALALDADKRVSDSILMQGLTIFAAPQKLTQLHGMDYRDIDPAAIFPDKPRHQQALASALQHND